jgi:hypothetical protein
VQKGIRIPPVPDDIEVPGGAGPIGPIDVVVNWLELDNRADEVPLQYHPLHPEVDKLIGPVPDDGDVPTDTGQVPEERDFPDDIETPVPYREDDKVPDGNVALPEMEDELVESVLVE